SVQNDFRISTERRISAVMLALRLYQLDHGGKLPAKLSELAGEYLPGLPVDPMAAGGELLGDGTMGTTGYGFSGSTDGRDDIAGGWTPALTDEAQWTNRARDFFVLLDSQAATQPAATAPAR